MASSKISELDDGGLIQPADMVPAARGGATVRLFGSQFGAIRIPSMFGAPTEFDHAFDCDFLGDIGSWVAAEGSEQAVVMLETSAAVARWDVDTLPGVLLFQLGHAGEVSLRADYTLADGESVTAGALLPGILTASGDNFRVGIGLNDNDADPDDGEIIHVMVEQDTTQIEPQSIGGGGATGGGELNTLQAVGGQGILFRVIRAGLVYYPFISMGGAWQPLLPVTATQALTNVWLTAVGPSAGQTHMPIGGWAYVKFSGDDFLPFE